MKNVFLFLALIVYAATAYSQSADVQRINQIITPDSALNPLHFLASDDLKGRSPKRPEIDIAANYISNYFQKAGVKEPDSSKDYFQLFELSFASTATSGSLKIKDSTYTIPNNLIQIGGQDVSIEAPIVFAGHGSAADLENIDIRGKIVISYIGSGDSSSTEDAIDHIPVKQSALFAKGAVAMIEIFNKKDVPWEVLKRYFGRQQVVSRKDSIPVLLLHTSDSTLPAALATAQQTSLITNGNKIKTVVARNVIGRIEGSDARLKEQHLVLSAHYDHIGVTEQPKNQDGKTDSIYNGARDNAIGVTAVLNAARYFAKYPSKRSMLFVLYTAEEMGLIGSRYFSNNPVIPLNKLVYNLNIDNAGYNDTTGITVIGLERTSSDDDIRKACAAYGLKVLGDPAPEANLFERSDNLSLAIKGIPAPTFSLGVSAMDSVIMKHYHQLSDESSTMNPRYALKYIRSYVLAAKLIANNPKQPVWKKDDKYEGAWKDLFDSE